jgi:hypothetical protein
VLVSDRLSFECIAVILFVKTVIPLFLCYDGKEGVVKGLQTQIISDSYVKSESALFYSGGFSFAFNPLKRVGGQNES